VDISAGRKPARHEALVLELEGLVIVGAGPRRWRWGITTASVLT